MKPAPPWTRANPYRPTLLAPGLTGIGQALTPLAAAGLCVVMVGAAWAHSRLQDPKSVALNVVLFAVAAFVVLGRLL